MADPGFRKGALDNASRELLIALALHSRAKPDPGAAAKQHSKGVVTQGRPRWLRRAAVGGGSSPDNPELGALCTAAHKHTSAKAVDLYAAAPEIDSVEPAPQHQAIADEIVRDWYMPVEQDPRTLGHAKLNLVWRFGEAARAISARRSQLSLPTASSSRSAGPNGPIRYGSPQRRKSVPVATQRWLSLPIGFGPTRPSGGKCWLRRTVRNTPWSASRAKARSAVRGRDRASRKGMRRGGRCGRRLCGPGWCPCSSDRRPPISGGLTPGTCCNPGSSSCTRSTAGPAGNASAFPSRFALAQGFKHAANRRREHHQRPSPNLITAASVVCRRGHQAVAVADCAGRERRMKEVIRHGE
jgi:hypothetical protein